MLKELFSLNFDNILMDFSLGKNSLDSYINFDANASHESDSLRSIKDYNKLETYLSLKK